MVKQNYAEMRTLRPRPAQGSAVAQEWFAEGVRQHHAERWDEAIRCYQQAIAFMPGFPEAHSNLGVAFQQQDRLDAALDCFGKAVALQPDFLNAHYNRGIVLQKLRRLDGAADCYRKALALQPDYAEAHCNLGIVLREQGRLQEAIACFRSAAQLRPDLAEAHNNLGVALRETKQLTQAEACYRQAIAVKPDYAEAHNNLGVILREQRQMQEAASCYRRAIALRPAYVEAANNLGVTLRELGRAEEAIACYRGIIAQRPDYAEAHSNLGVALREQGQMAEAVACYKAALALKPDYAEAHSNLGVVLREQEQPEAAAACYRTAISLRPGYPQAHNNLGVALKEQRRLDEAVDCFRQAVALDPEYAEAHNNLGMALLLRGEVGAPAWQEYEWRWKTGQMAGHRRDFTQPQWRGELWRGEPAAGRTLLIHAEQGYGDNLQFCRYAMLAAERGLRVVMEVQKPLVRLLAGLPGVAQVLARGEPLPGFDLHCPMLSLPLALGTTLASIPSLPAYLRADPALAGAWRQKLDAAGKAGRRIGLAWAGTAAQKANSRRSITPDRLAPLLALPGLHFVSLQKDGPPAPAAFALTDLMAEVTDFADTAALIASLDLVIAVDTAVAHLAAALGKPVWMLDRFDPDWRWLIGRTDSPWYPTLRLYRQPQRGDWATVVAAVASDLREGIPQGAAHPVHGTACSPAASAEAMFAEAVRHHQDGRLEEAAASYQQAIEHRPTFMEAHYNLGLLFEKQRRLPQAVDCFAKVTELDPGNANAHSNLGAALEKLGRLEEAAGCFRRALALRPDFPEARGNLGVTLEKQGRLAEAIACFQQALALKPDDTRLRYNLGVALRRQGRLAEAVDCYRTVIALQPASPEAHSNLGVVLQELGKLEEAVACLTTAVALRPDYPEALSNLGVALQEQGALDEAVAHLHRAIALKPDYAQAHYNLGVTLRMQGHVAAAVDCYRHAIALSPEYADAHSNLAMTLLTRGELAEGWAEYEWRWKTTQATGHRRDFPQAQWRGEPAAGRTLLIHAEQGFGDSLQFCRYAMLAAERGLRVVMEVQKPLVRLLAGLPGVAQVLARGEPLPGFDLHCPMLSLPLALGTTLASIPSLPAYLRADPALAGAWRQKLDAAGKAGRRVGLAWTGSNAMRANHRRSIPPERLAPLLALPGLHFVSLQKDGPPAPAAFALTDLMAEVSDFADTAALIASLDLVIAVDTAVAHLAAALGKPVWMLDRFDPDWRWLDGRRDSPWYPSLRLYRQPAPGDWGAVVAEVVQELPAWDLPAWDLPAWDLPAWDLPAWDLASLAAA